jgi:hypothetical protein
MKLLHHLLPVVTAGFLLAGCAVHTKEQIAAVRAKGVSPATVRKLDGRGYLTPADIIELRNRRVDDGLVIEHLDKVGVDYVIQKNDIKEMRAAGVRTIVIAAVLRASRSYVWYLESPRYHYYPYGYWGDPFYSPFYSPYYGYGPYGGYGWGYGYRRFH